MAHDSPLIFVGPKRKIVLSTPIGGPILKKAGGPLKTCSACRQTVVGTVAVPHCEALGEDALNVAPIDVPEDLRGEFGFLQEKASLSFLDQSGGVV